MATVCAIEYKAARKQGTVAQMELAVTESTTPWQQAQVLRDEVAFLRQELHAIQELDDREIKQ